MIQHKDARTFVLYFMGGAPVVSIKVKENWILIVITVSMIQQYRVDSLKRAFCSWQKHVDGGNMHQNEKARCQDDNIYQFETLSKLRILWHL